MLVCFTSQTTFWISGGRVEIKIYSWNLILVHEITDLIITLKTKLIQITQTNFVSASS